jgi:hypothetical protein
MDVAVPAAAGADAGGNEGAGGVATMLPVGAAAGISRLRRWPRRRPAAGRIAGYIPVERIGRGRGGTAGGGTRQR